jgi:GxxExxY protein
VLLERDLTDSVIASAIEVHRELGPGLLESAYEACLCHELQARSIPFQRQVALPVLYKGSAIECNYRIDILVADKLLLELKSVERLERVHIAQLMTYMKLSKKRIGLLINFNVLLLRQGLVRRVL